MSGTNRKAQTKEDRKGAVRNVNGRRTPSSTYSARIRQRTFPSETARRLMATMALDGGNPRALLNMTGGVVGHVNSLMPSSDCVESDSGDSTFGDNNDRSRETIGKDSDFCVSDGCEYTDGNKKGVNRRTEKKKRRKSICSFSIPSKPQMARTFSKCIPKQDVAAFERLFNSFQRQTSCPPGCDNGRIDVNALIIKSRVVTILWALQRLYGVDNVVCQRCVEMCGGRVDGKVLYKQHYLEIVAMDAVLARTLSPPRAVTGTETVDTPVRFLAQRKEMLDPKFDPMFRALVVVVPDGATYYCHRERRRACIGVANALIPMDTSWLRVKRNGHRGDQFALGGYVLRLWDGQPYWKFKICRGESNFQLRPIPRNPAERLSWDVKRSNLKVLCAYQMADEVGPAMPPDFVDGKQLQHWPSLRRAYRAAINNSPSSRRGCRHYAQSHLHRHIDPIKTLVIDPKDGDVDLRIAIQVKRAGDERKLDSRNGPKRDRLALSRESVVQIRYLPNLGSGAPKLVSEVWEHASTATKWNRQSARRGLGDMGSMHPIGTRIMKDNKTRERYKTSRGTHEQEALRKAVVASARLAAVTIPTVLRIIQDVEEDGDIDPPEGGMNGDGGCLRVSFTMDVSVDLANASHFDVNDATQGFSIWTEDEPGKTKEWYFVLPNVYGRRSPGVDGKPGDIFHGVAIKLTHGVLIGWDGRVIRHCTSVMDRENPAKHVYGTFFAAKTSVVAYGARMAFVREALRRVHAKQDRRLDRQRTATGESVGKAVTCVGAGGEGLDNVLCAPIPKKSKLDDVAMDHCSADERSVDGEESWSDYTYASGGSNSTGGKDGGLVLERDPFVERVENDLKETKAGDVVATGGELAPPVEQGTGPLTNCFSREVPVRGSCNRAPIDLVECDDDIGGYVGCVARCPGGHASRYTSSNFGGNSDRRGATRWHDCNRSFGSIDGCCDYSDGDRRTNGWEQSHRRCENLRLSEGEVYRTQGAPREHRGYGSQPPNPSGGSGVAGFRCESFGNHKTLHGNRELDTQQGGERKRPRGGFWGEVRVRREHSGGSGQVAGVPDWEPNGRGGHWEYHRGEDVIGTRDRWFGIPEGGSHRREGHGSNRGHRGREGLAVPRGDRWDGMPPGESRRGDSSCGVSRAGRGWCRTWNGGSTPEVDRQPCVFGSEHKKKCSDKS